MHAYSDYTSSCTLTVQTRAYNGIGKASRTWLGASAIWRPEARTKVIGTRQGRVTRQGRISKKGKGNLKQCKGVRGEENGMTITTVEEQKEPNHLSVLQMSGAHRRRL